MSEKCPQCGASLPAGALTGLCPACLLRQGATANTATRSESKPFVPPTVEEVARLFPQLEILGFLGKGGMGAVYKARQPALDRLVALKLLPAQAAPDSGFADRFTREARALARLSHPNIVAVHEFGQVSSVPAALPYFIMEFVDGVNLRQLQKAGRLSPREALQIVPQICDALQYAHDEGVVHRDIKPENVLVDRKGRVKIADFGLAKILGHDPEALRLTGEGQVMGTPHYMAPEQVEHPQDVDHRADIFSLGVVFYEMLTGELPLGKFQPPSRKVQVDVRLDEVVLHALEKEPERRYQQVSEVKTAVQEISASPLPPPGTRRQAASVQEVIPPIVAGAVEPSRSGRRAWKIAGGVILAVVVLNCVIIVLALRPALSRSPLQSQSGAPAVSTNAELQQLTDTASRHTPGVTSALGGSTSPARAATPEQLAEPPALRFLAWQDEWKTNQPGAARHPDGSPVTDAKEMDWLIQVRPVGLDVSPLKLSPEPRILDLWFSHPQFDESSLNEVSLLNERGVELSTEVLGQVGGNAQAANSLRGGLGWLTKTLSPGAGTNIPQLVSVRLRYTTSSIERTNLILIPGQTTNGALEGESRINETGQKTDGRVFVSIAMNANKMNLREFGILAFTRSGRELTASQVVKTPPDNAGIQLIEFVFDYPAVDKFIIGTRPIFTNEWKNVVLPLPREPVHTPSPPNGTVHEVIQLGPGFLNAIEFLCNDLHLEYVIDNRLLSWLAIAPGITNRMENLTSRQALTRLLDKHNLQLIENPQTRVAYITKKDVWKVVDAFSLQPVVQPPELSLAIRCTNTVTKVGDEIPIDFLISNIGTNYYRYANRTYDRSGRMGEYKLLARSESGEVVSDPRDNDQGFRMGGGLFQYQILMPGQSFSKTIALNRWALINRPGRYEVAGIYYPKPSSTNHATVNSASIRITVLSRTPQEMDDYISGLTNKIAALPPGPDYHGQVGATPELDNLVMKLMFTCSPKIVPTLLDCMYLPGHSGFWECEALLFHVPRSVDIKHTIIAAAAKRGLASNMESLLSTYGCSTKEMQPLIERSLAPDNPQSWTYGVVAAQRYANDAFTPRLVALATEPGNTARVQAIYALAANRTDESIKTLKGLLNDSDSKIRKATEQALRTAYHYRGNWQGRPLKQDDFDKKYQ